MSFGDTVVLLMALSLVLLRDDESPPAQRLDSSTLREYINNGSDPIDEDVEAHLIAIIT